MKFLIRYNLWRIKKDLNPSSQFKRELGASLSRRFDELHANHSVWHRIVVAKVTRIIIASSVGVSMVGTGAYAYNSPDVTVGTTLYPIKIGMENIVESTKTTPEAKAKFLLKKIERREAEKQTIVSRVGSEIKLTFSAITPTTTGSSTIEFTTSSITVSTKPAEVEQADFEVKEVEHQLAELRNTLSDRVQDQYLSAKISERLDRHQKDEDEEEKYYQSATTTAHSTSTVSEFSIVRNDSRDDQKIEIKKGIVETGKRFFRNTSVDKPEIIQIVQGGNGGLRVKDSEREYKIYSNSTSPEQLRQIFSTSSRIRLEIRNKENEVRSLTLEHEDSESKRANFPATTTAAGSSSVPQPTQPRQKGQKRGWEKFIRSNKNEDLRPLRNEAEQKKIEVKENRDDNARNITTTTPALIPLPMPITSTERTITSTSQTSTERREENKISTSTTATSGNTTSGTSGTSSTSSPREHEDD